jgi:hypothetical protein
MNNFSISDWIGALYQALKKSKDDLSGYDVVPIPYTSSQQVQLMRPCNGWTVINMGTTTVQVNGGITLAPTEFIAVSGNEREAYTGFLRLVFVSNTDVGNKVFVYQKFYTGPPAYDKLGL